MLRPPRRQEAPVPELLVSQSLGPSPFWAVIQVMGTIQV